jgi:hypothetical protein
MKLKKKISKQKNPIMMGKIWGIKKRKKGMKNA